MTQAGICLVSYQGAGSATLPKQSEINHAYFRTETKNDAAAYVCQGFGSQSSPRYARS